MNGKDLEGSGDGLIEEAVSPDSRCTRGFELGTLLYTNLLKGSAFNRTSF
jgi:hypothetical protein